MKTRISVLAVLLLIGLSGGLFASNDNVISDDRREAFETNLLAGLDSENTGLKMSSAYYLGELKSTKAILPLMKMLRSSENQDLRIIAALSLIKIESNSSVYMVKSESRFNEYSKIRDLCKRFYLSHLHKNSDKNEIVNDLKFALGIQ